MAETEGRQIIFSNLKGIFHQVKINEEDKDMKNISKGKEHEKIDRYEKRKIIIILQDNYSA